MDSQEISIAQRQQIEGEFYLQEKVWIAKSAALEWEVIFFQYPILHTADAFEGFLMKKYEAELLSLLMCEDPTLHYPLIVK